MALGIAYCYHIHLISPVSSACQRNMAHGRIQRNRHGDIAVPVKNLMGVYFIRLTFHAFSFRNLKKPRSQ
jgi:hypothetical protein